MLQLVSTSGARQNRQLGESGHYSSFELPEAQSFIKLRNVQVVEEGFIYYHDGAASSPVPPSSLESILTLQYWDRPEENSQARPACELACWPTADSTSGITPEDMSRQQALHTSFCLLCTETRFPVAVGWLRSD